MAIDLIQMAASTGDARTAMPGASPGSAGTRRTESGGRPNTSAVGDGEAAKIPAVAQADDGYLAAKIRHAQEVEEGSDTTFSYDRDEKDGQVYFRVKDSHTGKELYRIPKNMHSGMDPQPAPHPKVDVRV